MPAYTAKRGEHDAQSRGEEVRRAIEFRGPDRAPITHATLPRRGVALWRGAGCTLCPVSVGRGERGRGESTGEFGPQIGVPSRDTWGALWVRYTDEHKGQVVHSPLKDWGALSTYEPPDTASDALFAEMEAHLRHNEGQRYTLADGDTLWQRMFYLHGYRETLEDLLLDPDRCVALRDMILAVMVRRGGAAMPVGRPGRHPLSRRLGHARGADDSACTLARVLQARLCPPV
jgi:hypothetical protein